MTVMDLLHVSSYFAPAYAYGGTPRSVCELSKALAKRGHRVTVYATDVLDGNSRYKGYSNPVVMDGIEVHYLPNVSNRLAYRANLPLSPALLVKLRATVKKFDLVHLHEYRSLQSFAAHRYAEKCGKPYVLQPRGSLPRFGKSVQKRLFDDVFGQKIIEGAGRIVASSRRESMQYASVNDAIGSDKIIHIPNGLDLDEYRHLPGEGRFRAKFGIPDRFRIILYVGRLHQGKGADLLLEAFGRLLRDRDDLKLVIAGRDDGYGSRLRALAGRPGIAGNVIFPGFLSGEDRLAAYVDADVSVLPSKYESFGNVVLESIACGTPVIMTGSCGAAEYIDREYASVVDLDAGSLYRSLLSALQDDKKAAIRHSFAGYVRNFSYDSVAKLYEDSYRSMMDEKA